MNKNEIYLFEEQLRFELPYSFTNRSNKTVCKSSDKIIHEKKNCHDNLCIILTVKIIIWRKAYLNYILYLSQMSKYSKCFSLIFLLINIDAEFIIHLK